jgi:sugar lactone lactonase YvrE
MHTVFARFSASPRYWIRAPLAAWVLFAALLLPLAALAQSVPTYHVVLNWPVNNGQGAPDYHTVDITGVAVGLDGRVYMCHGAPHPVLVFDRNGNYLTSWGEGLFTEPHTIRADHDGNLWMTDYETQLIYKFSPEGVLLRTWGTRNVRGRDGTHFSGPTDVAFAPSGDVYISDGYGNSRVVHLSADGTYLGEWGNWGKQPGLFRTPHSIAVDAQGRVYVADRQNKRIQVFTGTGQFLSAWNIKDRPFSLWVSQDQLLYVACGSDTIRVLDLTGRQVTRWGTSGRRPGQFNEPHMLCIDAQGELYVAETGSKRLQKFTTP